MDNTEPTPAELDMVEPNVAPDPPSTPGLPVPAAAGPANSAPVASSVPNMPVQSWVVPTPV